MYCILLGFNIMFVIYIYIYIYIYIVYFAIKCSMLLCIIT